MVHRRRLRAAALGLVALVLVSCGQEGAPQPPAGAQESPLEEGGTDPRPDAAWEAALAAELPPPSAWPVPVEAPPDCGAGGSCMGGILVGGAFYGTSCGRIAEEHVTDEVIGDGLHQVNVVDGVDPSMFVAYRAPAQACNEDDTPPAGDAWHFAFAEDGDGGPAQDPAQICRVGDFTPREAEANGC